MRNNRDVSVPDNESDVNEVNDNIDSIALDDWNKVKYTGEVGLDLDDIPPGSYFNDGILSGQSSEYHINEDTRLVGVQILENPIDEKPLYFVDISSFTVITDIKIQPLEDGLVGEVVTGDSSQLAIQIRQTDSVEPLLKPFKLFISGS